MSSSKKPVVVYGASGYTGRLVCEYLREYGIPFIAAGRNADKIHAAMKSNVAGIETASYEVVEVIHTTEALTHLFKGASVVLNTVGPFAKFGPEVVEACLAAKCHYTDTTGEQDWLITLDERVRREVRRRRPAAVAGPGADVHHRRDRCAAVPRDARAWTRWTSPCSGAAARRSPRRRRSWSMRRWPRPTTWSRTGMSSGKPDAGLYSLSIPGQHEAALALPWGGTSHPVWFKRDPRVANVKVLGGVFNRPLMQAVPQIVAAALKATEGMNADDRYAALAKTAAGVMNSMPPRENPRINKSVDSVHASGPLGARALRHLRQLQLQADRLAAGLCRRLAAAAGAQARRASRRVARPSATMSCSGALRSFGLVQAPVLTVHQLTLQCA